MDPSSSTKISKKNPNSKQHHINIPSVSNNQPPQLSNPALQNTHDETREDNNGKYHRLYKASITGNWESARVILGKQQDLVRLSISESYGTVLHIAVLGKSHLFVESLMSMMENEDLELRNKNGQTALVLAAITGDVEIATILVGKNNRLLHIVDNDGKTPLYMAALYRKSGMVDFLYQSSLKMKGDFWTDENRGGILVRCVEANLFDVALQMVTDHPELAKNGSVNGNILGLLARKPKAFYVMRLSMIGRFIRSFLALCHVMTEFDEKESSALQLLRKMLEEIGELPQNELAAIIKGPADEENKGDKQIYHEKETQEALQLLRTISENVAKIPAKTFSLFRMSANDVTTIEDTKKKYSSGVLFLAAEMGNTAFILEVIQQYPHLVLEVNDNNRSIFHVAVSHGHEGIYKLLYELGSNRDLIVSLEDKNGNNMLHLVGEKAKGNQVQNVRGVALRINPDIFWFKVHPGADGVYR